MQLHLMLQGTSHDIPLVDLDVTVDMSDPQIKLAVANHMSIPESKLDNFTVDRNSVSGDITLRPGAVFGS